MDNDDEMRLIIDEKNEIVDEKANKSKNIQTSLSEVRELTTNKDFVNESKGEENMKQKNKNPICIESKSSNLPGEGDEQLEYTGNYRSSYGDLKSVKISKEAAKLLGVEK